MKRIIYIVLIQLVVLSSGYRLQAASNATLMDSLDVYGFNDVQQELIHTEVTAYTQQISKETAGNMDAFKAKMKELFNKLRDGFRIYKLAREPKTAERIAAFDAMETGLNVYVYAYVEGAFLNNIFQRLSQTYYQTLRPDTYVSLTYKFSQAPAYTQASPLFLPAPVITYSDAVKTIIGSKLSESTLSASAKNEFTNSGGYNIIIDDVNLNAHFYKSVDDVLNELAGVYIAQGSSSSSVSNGIALTVATTFVTPWGEPFTLPKGATILQSCNAYMYSDNYFLHEFSYNGNHYTWKLLGSGLDLDGYIKAGESAYNNPTVLESPVKITGAIKNVVLVDQSPFITNISKADGTFEKANSLTITLKEAVLSTPVRVTGGNRRLKHFTDVSELTIGRTIQQQTISSPCSDQTGKPLSVAATDPAIDAYIKGGKLQNWLKTQSINGSVWITNCKTGKGYVINGTSTTASTTSTTAANAIVNGKQFNGDIGISACYDPDTKKWTINHAFKEGVLTPPAKYAGELVQLKTTSDQYVENVINKKNAKASGSGVGSMGAGSGDPDFKYADLGIVQAVLAVKDFTKQIVNAAKVPEEYWDNTKPEYKTSPVNVPALFCGAGDQGLENATELVQLLDLGLTMATEPEMASQMWSSIKNVKWEDVKKLAGSATGYENYAKGGCYATYQGGKHAVVIVVGLAAVAGKSLKSILSELDEGVANAGKSLDDIADILTRVLKRLQDRLSKLSADNLKIFKTDLTESQDLLKYLDEAPNPEKLVDAWEKVAFSEVRKNTDFLNRVSDLPSDLQVKVGDLYKNMKAPAGKMGKVDFIETKIIDGENISVYYDKDGFPDFTPYSPNKDYLFSSNSLTGSGTDMTLANNWARNKFGTNNVKTMPNGTIQINGEIYTWHHHQDGRSMFPVPSKVHNLKDGGFGHTGGAAVIERGLQDLFNSPTL